MKSQLNVSRARRLNTSGYRASLINLVDIKGINMVLCIYSPLQMRSTRFHSEIKCHCRAAPHIISTFPYFVELASDIQKIKLNRKTLIQIHIHI